MLSSTIPLQKPQSFRAVMSLRTQQLQVPPPPIATAVPSPLPPPPLHPPATQLSTAVHSSGDQWCTCNSTTEKSRPESELQSSGCVLMRNVMGTSETFKSTGNQTLRQSSKQEPPFVDLKLHQHPCENLQSHTLISRLLKRTRPERNLPQAVRCVCSISCECARTCSGETSRLLSM
jgi:hypothetical protein